MEKNNRLEEAAEALEKAARLAQTETGTNGLVLNQVVHALRPLGQALKDQGKVVAAEVALRQALVLAIERWGEEDLETIVIRRGLARLYYDQGHYRQAEPLYVKELELNAETREALGIPYPTEALQHLMKLYEATGQAEQVTRWRTELVGWYRKAAESGDVGALNRVAWLLATSSDPKVRDGLGAVGYAEKAVAATDRKDHAILDTLAAAYAEAGQFTNAISTQKEAIGLVQDANAKKDYESRLKLYEASQPYHEAE